jgi:hypothetical protein
MPAEPDFLQAVRVAAGGQHFFQFAQRHACRCGCAGGGRAVLGLAVGAGHAGRQTCVGGTVGGFREHQRLLHQHQLARARFRQLEVLVAARLQRGFTTHRQVALVGLGRHRLGVLGDEVLGHPFGALGVQAQLLELVLGFLDEALGF